MSEKECEQKGHEKCSDIALNGATVWLPTMIGFMENGRPIYLQGLGTNTVEVEGVDENGDSYTEERTLTKDEQKERNVVAGGIANEPDINYNYGSPIIIGGWYPTPLYYSYGFSSSRPVLSEGMAHSYQSGSGPRSSIVRSGGSTRARTVTVGRSGGTSTHATVRGGFGGRGFSSGG